MEALIIEIVIAWMVRRVYENGDTEFTYVHENNDWNKYKRATV